MQHFFIPPGEPEYSQPMPTVEFIDERDFMCVAQWGEPDLERPTEAITIEDDRFGRRIETCLGEDLGLSAARCYRAIGELVNPIQEFMRDTPDILGKLGGRSEQLFLIIQSFKKAILAAHILYKPVEVTDDPYASASVLYVARCLAGTNEMDGPRIGPDDNLALPKLIARYRAGHTDTYLGSPYSAAGRSVMAADLFADQRTFRQRVLNPDDMVHDCLSLDDLRVLNS